MPRIHPGFISVLSVVIGAISRLASAQVRPSFAYFEKDSRVRIEELHANREARLSWSVEDRQIKVDASAVLEGVDFEKMKTVSMDFNRWSQFKMPGVREMHALEMGPEYGKTFPRVVWVHQETLDVGSRHYMKVFVDPGIEPVGYRPSRTGLAFGNTFELFHPTTKYRKPGNERKTLDDRPVFKRFEGSWYLEPLSGDRLYARYVMMAEVDSMIPAFLMVPISRAQMVSGIKEMFQIFRKQANRAGISSESKIEELDWVEVD